ncbi:putative nuclease HARBI1 [Penaeus japonicus]|uniref:putative nuclease HARBI1 n=1 Tax=Penaeus japonicus TaxID=27405 RepID=UPI001C712852|nr:putative nuclease HARBI1 [Penaeus japonicus]
MSSLTHVVTGESFASLGYQFRVGKTTVHRIVKTTSNAIWETLQPHYMPVPNEHQWKEIAKNYFEKCNIPCCVGAIDGKHCRLKCPSGTGFLFYNYKGYHSIVLLAIADANCCFTLIDVGSYGRNSDSPVFTESNMGKQFLSRNLDIPQSSELGEQQASMETSVKVAEPLVNSICVLNNFIHNLKQTPIVQAQA